LVSAGFVENLKLNPRIRNMVASVDIGHGLDLPNLTERISGIIYEPEQFPGAMIRSKGESVSFLIFASGKAVIAGAKSFSELRIAMKKLGQILQEHEQEE
jgi:transcription initiation factor TFIID TATA-box-binding protein